MKVVEVPANRQIVLPKRFFKPADKIAIFSEGNAVLIKKFEPPRLSSIAARVRERALPLREVAREVRAYRRAKRAR